MCPTPTSSIRRALGRWTTWPATTTSPLSGCRRPVIASISSLWPLPSTPAMPTISPARTANDTSRTAGSPRSSFTCRSRTSSSTSPASAGFLSTRSSTSRPTIILASPSSVAPSRGTVSIFLPAPQHRDPVGDLEHLVQLVADEDDRRAALLQALDDSEQLARLLRRQHGGRLVEDQDVGAAVERLQDLDALLPADADALDLRGRVDREAVLRRDLAHALDRLAVVEQHARLGRLDLEHDVLGDRHHRDQHEVLVHHPDPAVDRVLGRAEHDLLAVEQDLALVGPVEAVEDVHQRRLARAVLAEEREHLALAQVEIDLVVRDDPGEPLRDAPHLEDR